MGDLLDKIRSAIKTLAARPAMTLTPDAMAEQIAAVAAKARAEDSATIGQARERIDKAANRIESLTGQTVTARDQHRRIWYAIGGGALAGCLLWSFLPGVILRAMPQGWHMPERMASHIVGEPTLWEAGTRLMQADSPRAWNALSQAAEMLRENREAIDACEQQATKAKQPVRCTIRVGYR